MKKSLFFIFFIGYIFLSPLFSFGQEHTQEFKDFMNSIQDVQTDINDIGDTYSKGSNTGIVGISGKLNIESSNKSSGSNPLKIISWILTSGSIFFYFWKKYWKG